MKKGWIKLHRSLKDKGYYQDSEYVHLWIHLLLSASHSGKEFLWNNEIRKLKPGQLITGRKKLAKETGINEYKIERILKCLESAHQIAQQMNSKFRLIQVNNWIGQKENAQQMHNKCTTNAHIQECKECKEELANANSKKEKANAFSKKRTPVKKQKETSHESMMLALMESFFARQGEDYTSAKYLYGKEMLEDFSSYWREKTIKGGKERWRTQETWSLKGRLVTWSKRAKNVKPSWNPNGKESYKDWMVRMVEKGYIE